MKWITLIGDQEFDFESIKKISYLNAVPTTDYNELNNRLCYEINNEYVFFEKLINHEDFDDYFSALTFVNPTVIMMIYSSCTIAKKILLQNDFPHNIFVDNDYGIIVPLRTFIEKGLPMES